VNPLKKVSKKKKLKMCLAWPQEASEFGKTSEETDVCADLITHFSTLFHMDADEMKKVGITIISFADPDPLGSETF